MSWAKIDDQFHSNEKALSCSLAARGLWTVCLSWVADKESDGNIPKSVVRLHAGAQWQDLSGELVEAGLWVETETGWAFHDYLHYNPSKAQLDEERQKAADRKAAWKKRQSHSSTEENDTRTATERRSSSVPNGEGTLHPDPVPVYVSSLRSETPPNPHSDEGETLAPDGAVCAQAGRVERPSASPASRRKVRRNHARLSCVREVTWSHAELADWFESVFWRAYPRKEAAPDAWRAITKAFDDRGGDVADRLECLQRDVMTSLQAASASAQWQDPTKVPHPATWINRRPWESDAPPLPSAPSSVRSKVTLRDRDDEIRSRYAARLANEFPDLLAAIN